jgi:hypothetical protein
VRRLVLVVLTAALLAAVFLLWQSLPPKPLALDADRSRQSDRVVSGAFHVHTRSSDGSGTVDEIAAAAARAGLKFIIITDHGDGTADPSPPRYLSGVLCIDAVEISTDQGHYLAIGLPRSPYPLGGEPRDVVEDVRRLGGFGIVAHPDSQKPSLQWREWTAAFDGIEWLNADSEWRDESRARLLHALITYPFRPVETIGSLFNRPETTMLRWDALVERRRVVGVAGTDAHARLGLQDDGTAGLRLGGYIRMPSYEVSLRAFAVRVALPKPWSGNASADAADLLAAIRAGHLFTAIDALASPATLEFAARNEGGSADQGDLIEPHGPLTITARVNASTDGRIVLRRSGTVVAEHSVPELTFAAGEGAGVFRAEVYVARNSAVPWIVSNPIYVEPKGWGTIAPRELPRVTNSWNIQGGPWHVEQGGGSTGRISIVDPPKGPVSFDFTLAGGPRAGQYAALVISVGNALTGHSRFAFTADASSPMRLSIQARRPTGGRWQRSIYLDQTVRNVIAPFTDLTPVAPTEAYRFEPPQIDSVLFVVDTTNTKPGATGRVTIRDLVVEH